MSLGTPAYMAPEQAVGDPDIDHRADLYAWGVLAYELLAGQHPFADHTSTRALFAAHITTVPPSLPAHVPAALASLVMQALAKAPSDRPATTNIALAALNAARDADVEARGLALATSGALPTRAVVFRALGIYSLIVLLIAVGTPRVMDGFGLPDWVLPGALSLVALGLPLVLLALFVRHQAPLANADPEGVLSQTVSFAAQARPFLRLPRLAWGGAALFGAFALVVIGWMSLRAMGIGPAGSLLAAGTLRARDTVVVADLRVSGPDTALGPVMAEAVRTDLSQSRALTVAPVSQIVAALRRMERNPARPFEEALATEVAQREGMKAVVSGDLTPLGSGYVVSLRLRAATTGDVLASFQESADVPGALIPTIQRLTRALRGKVGESLTALRADPPLERMTTASLPALRKATAAWHAQNIEGEFIKAAALFREAIALDSTFAGAYRGLAVALANVGIDVGAKDSAFVRAYLYRDRLPERERLRVAADYFRNGPEQDRRRAGAAYSALLALDPVDGGVLSSYGLMLLELREWDQSESMLRRAFAVQPSSPVAGLARMYPQLGRGRVAAVDSTLAEARTRWPTLPLVGVYTAQAALDTRNLDIATVQAERLMDDSTSASIRALGATYLARLALERGQPSRAETWFARARDLWRSSGDPDAPLADAVMLARIDLWTRDAPSHAVGRLDAALARYTLAARSNFAHEQALLYAAGLYAAAGAPDKGRTLLADVESAAGTAELRQLVPDRARVRAELALAAGKGPEALRLFRAIDVAADGGPASPCSSCMLPDLARAAERAGWADSARIFWSLYADQPGLFVNTVDPWHLARAYRRLSDLWGAVGDQKRAATYNARYAALRADAEPAQPPRLRTRPAHKATPRRSSVPARHERTPA